jgi:uncharacterized protein
LEPIARPDIHLRIQRDNPWWTDGQATIPESTYPRRVYFASFKALALNREVRRATILLGPRRVGKTVIIKQLIHEAILAGTDHKSILYASIDAPIYSGMSLEHFLEFLPNDTSHKSKMVIYDEIQYLPVSLSS